MIKKLTLEAHLQEIKGQIPPKYYEILVKLSEDYLRAVVDPKEAVSVFLLFLELLQEQFRSPYLFEIYHQKIRKPVDYYRFGIDFVRLLVDLPRSRVVGREKIEAMAKQLRQKNNVILLANHQTEPDPQLISILLEKIDPKLAESIIYVAGERVVTDPLAIPFSMGCDLLCIYSKRYIDHPPELREEKQLHNKKTMELMSRLLKEGGKIIYVAPSGGRDRKNSEGIVEVAPFDPDSIEMFYLMAKKSKTATHFYPLTLATYALFPPPEGIQKELGEQRSTQRAAVHLAFSSEFSMEKFPGSDETDKQKRRANRAHALWSIVAKEYNRLTQ